MADRIQIAFQRLMDVKPNKPNMEELDEMTWAVCDKCGEWCNPADGPICWSCWDTHNEEDDPTPQEVEFAVAALFAMYLEDQEPEAK